MDKRYYEYPLKRVILVEALISLFYSDWTERFRSRGERHDFWEVIYLDKGRILVETDCGEPFPLEAGQAWFHRPNEYHVHSSLDDHGASVCVMAFRCSGESLHLLERRRLAVSEHGRRIISQLLRYGSRAFSFIDDTEDALYMGRKPDASALMDQLILSSLELFLADAIDMVSGTELRRDDSQTSDAVNALSTNRHRALVSAAIELLKGRIYERIRIPELCLSLNCSKTTLSSAFKEYTGSGIIDYFNNLKIEKAKELIRHEDLNLTQIAERLAFCNLHYFSNAFKARTGIYPSQYAKSIRVYNGTYMLSDVERYGIPGSGSLAKDG